MATQEQSMDNTIVDGFRTVNKKVQEYPELDWGPSVSNIYAKRTVKKLDGMPVTKEQIQSKAAKFSDADSSKIKVQENGKGTDWESYTATVDHANNGKLMMDFTRNGGCLSLIVIHVRLEAKSISSGCHGKSRSISNE